MSDLHPPGGGGGRGGGGSGGISGAAVVVMVVVCELAGSRKRARAWMCVHGQGSKTHYGHILLLPHFHLFHSLF